MDMYITALQPAPATPGPRSGDCLGPNPEPAGIAIKIAPISRQIWDAKYRLKAYDALHLATVDLMEVTLRSSVSFACFDDALNRAAVRMGFALITGA